MAGPACLLPCPAPPSLIIQTTIALPGCLAAQNPLRRSTMEDVYRLLPCFDGDDGTSFVGIYDGHGGRDIVDFLATELERNIALELKVEEDDDKKAAPTQQQEQGQEQEQEQLPPAGGDEGPSTTVPERLCRYAPTGIPHHGSHALPL